MPDQHTDSTIGTTPPVAEKHPVVTTLHGDERIDNYRWLHQKNDPEVIQHLEAENAYAMQALKHTEELQQKLYQEMLSHIRQTDQSVPYRKGDYYYYSRTEEGSQYPIFCRKHGSPEAAEQIVLDLNKLAEGHSYMALGAYEVSDDGNLLAYSIDTTGFREYTLHVLDMRTGELLSERIEHVVSVDWAADNRTLFYTVEHETSKRSWQLYRHTVGSNDDIVVYQEDDERFRIGIHRTRSKRFLLLYSGSHTTTEMYYLSADDPNGEWKLIAGREQDREYDVDHHDEHFYIRVNDTGRNFRLVRAPIESPGVENWEEIVPHRENVMIAGTEYFADHRVLIERHGGLEHLHVTDMRSGEEHHIDFPEPSYEIYASTNEEWDTDIFRYTYSSLVTPRSVYDYDMNTHERTLLKRYEVEDGYDPNDYVSERFEATAQDGTRVPISVVYHRGLKRDGSAPLLLEAYGSYGFPYPLHFSSNRLSLLDRGFVVAIAHIRGGGDMGKPWHDAGRMHNKMNTFTDFIACAEHLIQQKYTSPSRLIIQGGSAGGLLMGAVCNLRPDLFGAVVSHVPFVDVINTMLDTSLPLTVGEFEEWGNPAEKDDYDYISTYCPYTNVGQQGYPAMLVKTSLHDSQVMYWEPAKYVAKIRELRTDDNPLLLVINMHAGHGGASGRYDYLHEIALDYAFMLDQMGIDT
jgi:oligopeptidase B